MDLGQCRNAVLVLRIWREPAFRARITFGDADDPHAECVLLSSEEDVLQCVRAWLSDAGVVLSSR